MTDADPGPLIRLYGLTGGRARPPGEAFDLVAIVTTTTTIATPIEPSGLNPEQHAMLAICREPTPVADVAAQLGLPLNITRVLLGDLRREGLVDIAAPQPVDETIDERTYRDVLHGIRRL